jgi:hypothetical protein
MLTPRFDLRAACGKKGAYFFSADAMYPGLLSVEC